MDKINKLELTVAAWYKNVPHLPLDLQKWLATNAWWLACIGVIVGGLVVFTVISATLLAGAVLTGVAGAVGAVVGGIALIAVVLSSILAIIDLIIIGAAIMPLKARAKRGWTLLFITVLINVLSIAVSLVLSLDIIGAIWSLLMTAVGAYFLFEIRHLFGATRPIAHPETKKLA